MRGRVKLLDLMIATAIVAAVLALVGFRVRSGDTERWMLGVPGRAVDVDCYVARLTYYDLVGRGRSVQLISDFGSWRLRLP